MRVKLIAETMLADEDGVTYATLTNGSVSVTCEDALHYELDEQDDLDAAFDEWCELADAGEEGYTMEECN
jgi:predicted transcriptional regulator